MAKNRTTYRIFIASPSGLDAERVAFRETIEEYNKSDAEDEGVRFEAVGWEDTLGGARRPQEIINEELHQCDYFVMILWDRWGSPPDNEGKFSSGTEEELNVALKCLLDDGKPMRQVVMFFKGVPAPQMADPGEELQKVLAFRKSIEAANTHLFHSFDEVEEFVKWLRRHLASWRRGAVAEGGAAIHPPGPMATEAPAGPVPDEVTEALDKAAKLANEGKLTEAEAEYARLIVQTDSLEALNQYGVFLMRVSRLAQAQVMFERVGVLAQLRDDDRAMVMSFGNLGILCGIRGNLAGAEEMFEKVIAVGERSAWYGVIANAHGNLGLVYLGLEEIDKADSALRKALRIFESIGCLAGVANQYANLVLVHYARDEPTEAERALQESLAINKSIGRQREIAGNYGNLGLLHARRHELAKAEEMHRRALEMCGRLGDLNGMAQQYGNLGNICLSRGRPKKAKGFYTEALHLFEKIGLEGEVAKVRECVASAESAAKEKSPSSKVGGKKTQKKAKKSKAGKKKAGKKV